MVHPVKSPYRRVLHTTKTIFLLSAVLTTIPFTWCIHADTKPNTAINKGDWEIKKQQALLGKGMNLGNALDAPTEGAWGVVLHETYFSHVKKLGFESVRIPIRWSAHVAKSAPYTIDEAFFKRVEWAVNQALGNNLRVIINIHHFEGLMADPQKEKPVLLAIWQQVAKRFSTFGPRLYFEICNEPTGKLTPALWNVYAKEALDTIRATNPCRSVLIGPGLWNSIDGLPDFVVPADSFLILSMHYYKPDVFTHQGAYWVKGSNAWLGTKWYATQFDTSSLISNFNTIDIWASRKGITIFLGEFGAFDSADNISRVLYTSFVAKQAQKRGWSYAYWKYNSDFGIFNDSTNTTRNDLVDALLRPAETFAAYLPKALADTGTVDPGSPRFVILDDFEDSLKLQNSLASLYSTQENTRPESSFCEWSSWYMDSSTINDPNGNRILNYIEVDSLHKKSNFDKLVGPWGKSGNGLHAKGILKGSNYPIFGFGTDFTGKYNKDWFDFSSLSAISFWAKGSGEMRINITTDTVLNGYPATENWGHFGKDFNLTPKWKHYVIPVKELKPRLWSGAEKDNLKWNDGMEKVCNLDFSSSLTYGKIVDAKLDIYIDNIRLYGLTYETFGLKAPK